MNTPIITLDLDWSPDWLIRNIAVTLLAASVKATWFITHDSPAIQSLREHPEAFEICPGR